MPRMIICAIAMLLVATATSAEPKGDRGGSTSTVYRFAGYTDETPNAADTIDGDESFIAMHALCQDDFGPDARMCTDQELFRSSNIEAPSSSAWVQHDGLFTSADCDGWSSIVDAGLVIQSTGFMKAVPCNNVLLVACCTPVQ